jgi:hypothetical protein
LITRNRALLAQAMEARQRAREAVARAERRQNGFRRQWILTLRAWPASHNRLQDAQDDRLADLIALGGRGQIPLAAVRVVQDATWRARKRAFAERGFPEQPAPRSRSRTAGRKRAAGCDAKAAQLIGW